MVQDIQHQNLIYESSEIEHRYGENIHILSDPFHLDLLARLCHPQTFQPWVNIYVEKLYSVLFSTMVNLCFPRRPLQSETRMKAFHIEGVFEGMGPSREESLVIVNLARAGTYPSHLCYEAANLFFTPSLVRQDHIYVNRKVDERGKVIGVDMSGAKVGGGVDKAFVVIPDPMAATGGTLSHVLNHYREKVEGQASRWIALHLIVTPEYLRRVKRDHPELTVIAMRLDRGLSPAEVLNSVPGTYWDREVGLNDKQYIVPGGGGLGEVLNNSFV